MVERCPPEFAPGDAVPFRAAFWAAAGPVEHSARHALRQIFNDGAADVSDMELTILMPCLNEARTLPACVGNARAYLDRSGVVGEVLVADNGSTDGSPDLATAHGARVVHVPERGYGAALRTGIQHARGALVIFGDADNSYDFSRLDPFVDALRDGADVVVGNRFLGGIEAGAMPILHRYLGNPVLSWLGRLFFDIPLRDFHCGLRGIRRDAFLRVESQTTGMEFASEMIVRSSLGGLRICEVPTTLSRDGRDRAPHLRTWRDGWRHLRFLLLFSPRWLFLYPGLAMMLLGAVLTARLIGGPVTIGRVGFDVHTLLFSAALTLVGAQVALFAVIARTFAATTGLLPADSTLKALWARFSLEAGISLSFLLIFLGLLLGFMAVLHWRAADFGSLLPAVTMRTVIPSLLLLVLGVQGLFASFLLSLLGIARAGGTEPAR
jgi:hypothetical protein